jgi:hypothetical protein
MHRILQDFEENDRQVLDRLVDGELSDLERKELLSALDDEPSGWRRCALAFLEGQSWESDLKAFRHEPPPAVSRAARLKPWQYLPVALAMAASLVIAFVGGIALQGGFSSGSANTQLAQQGAAKQSDVAIRSDDSKTPTDPVTWKTFKLGTPDGQQVDIQALVGSSRDPSWLLNSGSAIPADVMAQLEQHGYRVEREKELWPSQLQDGSRLVVPVEQVQLHYVGSPAYQ